MEISQTKSSLVEFQQINLNFIVFDATGRGFQTEIIQLISVIKIRKDVKRFQQLERIDLLIFRAIKMTHLKKCL